VAGLTGHYAREHNDNRQVSMYQLYGTKCMVCGSQAAEHQTPDGSTATSLSAHVFRRHGVSNVSQMAILAAMRGDPQGYLADQFGKKVAADAVRRWRQQ
jgi:hypothetical protein